MIQGFRVPGLGFGGLGFQVQGRSRTNNPL